MNTRNIMILIVIIIIVTAGFFLFVSEEKREGDLPVAPMPVEPVVPTAPTDDSLRRELHPVQEVPFEENEARFYKDLIRVDTPLPESTVSSPLTVRGAARGNWFFEASFPVILTDWDGRIIAEGIAQAEGEWMTTEYVPFTAQLTFTPDTEVSNRGSLILKKDNPSALPEHDDAFEFTVYFAQ